MNVDVAVVVPAPAVNVTGTPVFQFALVSVTLVGACVITVLPERVIVTVTEPDGAAERRTDDGALLPPARDNVFGTKLIVGVAAWITNVTVVDTVLSAGLPLSTAVAVAVWLPVARPVAVKLYGEVVSDPTRVPSTRKSTRATAPPGSLAFADSATLVVPTGNDWLLVGAVSETVGGVLPPLVWTTNGTAVDVVLSAGLAVSNAVAVAEWLPAATVAVTL